jgi:hypothetical protein
VLSVAVSYQLCPYFGGQYGRIEGIDYGLLAILDQDVLTVASSTTPSGSGMTFGSLSTI